MYRASLYLLAIPLVYFFLPAWASAGTPSSRKTLITTCEKDTRKRPVCFTCKEAIQIMDAKDRLIAWPKKCKARVRRALEVQSIQFRRRLLLKDNELQSCESRVRIHIKDRKRNTWIVPALLGVGIGVAVAAAIIVPIMMVR